MYQLGTLGACGACERSDLPSSVSVKSALRGEPHGVARVVVSTALRALLIAPGVAVGGARGARLVAGSLIGSIGITGFLFAWYGIHK